MVLVREGTLLTGRPPLVGEVRVNVCGKRELRDQHNPYGRIVGSIDPITIYIYRERERERERERGCRILG
jgi:hypothetical protein